MHIPFVRSDSQTTLAYEGIHAIKADLIQHEEAVIEDEDQHHIGILSPLNIVQRQHNPGIDCLTAKPARSLHCDVGEVLRMMQSEQSEVLPVYHEKGFEGLIFKNDVLEFVRMKRRELEKEVAEQVKEIKAISEQLVTSRHILQAIFDSTQSYILLIDPEFRVIFFNKRAQEGSRELYAREFKLGDSILEYNSDTDEMDLRSFRENFSKAINTGSTVVSEQEIRYPNMTSSWLRSEYTPVYDRGVLIGVALRGVDITDRKHYELQIEMQTEVLQQISWIQSHQTRQPVATILGLINILEKSSLTEDNRKIVTMLEETAHKLDDVIRETVIKANSM